MDWWPPPHMVNLPKCSPWSTCNATHKRCCLMVFFLVPQYHDQLLIGTVNSIIPFKQEFASPLDIILQETGGHIYDSTSRKNLPPFPCDLWFLVTKIVSLCHFCGGCRDRNRCFAKLVDSKKQKHGLKDGF